ncbi:hypothetical protein EVAR_68230_1 [Eumeta japonica]|uniref:Uncharacterized protein n=1 Tax=Eumeta variegata TaxID=151549 RepID=A0A4C2AAP3_EUMVA|nr:hypothetical protein EVAR_68230_1 [Eumeta japonica]
MSRRANIATILLLGRSSHPPAVAPLIARFQAAALACSSRLSRCRCAPGRANRGTGICDDRYRPGPLPLRPAAASQIAPCRGLTLLFVIGPIFSISGNLLYVHASLNSVDTASLKQSFRLYRGHRHRYLKNAYEFNSIREREWCSKRLLETDEMDNFGFVVDEKLDVIDEVEIKDLSNVAVYTSGEYRRDAAPCANVPASGLSVPVYG